MKKLILCILIILIISVYMAGCSTSNATYEKRSYEFFGTFDTVVQLIGYTKTEKEFNKYSAYAYERFLQLNQLYDIYNDYDDVTNIKTINDNAGVEPIEVSDEIINLIEFCIDSNDNISDKVNIAMGPVLELWHDAREASINDPLNATLPIMEDLQQGMLLSNIKNIVIDKNNHTVFLKEQGMSLDVGAAAKGYATEIVSAELHKMGFSSFLLSGGGNVKVVGAPLDGIKEFWSIGLQNPYYFQDSVNQQNLIDTVYINNTSIVTSGDYQRFYYVDGQKYHHLIDPNTLMPATYFSSVTIFTQDSGLADFLSTTIFLMPYEQGRLFVDGLDDVEAYWVFTNGTAIATDNILPKLKLLGGATND